MELQFEAFVLGEEGHYFFLDLFFFGGIGHTVPAFNEFLDLCGYLFLLRLGLSFFWNVVFTFHATTIALHRPRGADGADVLLIFVR